MFVFTATSQPGAGVRHDPVHERKLDSIPRAVHGHRQLRLPGLPHSTHGRDVGLAVYVNVQVQIVSRRVVIRLELEGQLSDRRENKPACESRHLAHHFAVGLSTHIVLKES